MSQLNTHALIVGSVAGQTIRAFMAGSFSLDADVVDTWQRTLADDAADGTVTAWDASVSPVDSPLVLAILVDPDHTKSSVLPIAVEVVADGQTLVFNVTRRFPLVFSAPQADLSDITSLSGAITRIRVRNNNAAPSSGNNDVPVFVVAMK